MLHSPFPGMDPYLESPDLWPDVHARLSNILADQLMPQIAPKYVAELQTQLLIDQIPSDPKSALPDITITRSEAKPLREESEGEIATMVKSSSIKLKVPLPEPTRATEIYVRRIEGEELITVIEIRSPANKRPGPERKKYIQKRFSFLDSTVHLIEIDLLRSWSRMPFEGDLPTCNYLVMVSRSYERPDCEVWPLTVRDPLPVIPVPLRQPDRDARLDLGLALRVAYERARYDLRINYQKRPVPPLAAADMEWATSLSG